MSESDSEFERFVAPHRAELHRYCYRVLGSLADADDALQETLVDAWRGFAGFEGHGTPRGWLFRIASHACIRIAEKRPKCVTASELGPPSAEIDVESRDDEIVWLAPYPTDPAWSYEQRESIELAFIAALQALAPRQRAVLILREVVGLSAEEVAAVLDTSIAATNSALQRARETLVLPARTQQSIAREMGAAREAELAAKFVRAWNASDVAAIVALLVEDSRFTMPPLRTWLSGRAAIESFLRTRVFASTWELAPTHANGQLAFVCRQGPTLEVGALNVLTLTADGRIKEMTAFLDPATKNRFVIADR